MIKTKKELKFYKMADLMMNRGKFNLSLLDYVKIILGRDDIIRWLRLLRICTYLSTKNKIFRIIFFFKFIEFDFLSKKLGFSIGYNFGYGLVLPHYGTIVGGHHAKIGNYAVLHTCTCITARCDYIGDGLYLSKGAVITSQHLGNNFTIGANSVVNKSFKKDNILVGGIPAEFIKETEPWYVRDGFANRVIEIENLKREMFNDF